ncbi:Swt1 family HEPN domain-containing protein [Bacillus salitolerans]|uniref:Swt1 family HEPN domain-containing protein n=1 Tax=Bacillus salitolerans TaxID=1437434 RepID=A0ABW4LIT4_9BACI
MENTEVQFMMFSYKKLYVKETSLRRIIKEKMHEEYGPNWQHIAPMKHHRRFIKPIDVINLHELLNYFNVFPPLFKVFNKRQKILLSQLPAIRNKIAHCHFLNSSAEALLHEIYSFVTLLNNKVSLEINT